MPDETPNVDAGTDLTQQVGGEQPAPQDADVQIGSDPGMVAAARQVLGGGPQQYAPQAVPPAPGFPPPPVAAPPMAPPMVAPQMPAPGQPQYGQPVQPPQPQFQSQAPPPQYGQPPAQQPPQFNRDAVLAEAKGLLGDDVLANKVVGPLIDMVEQQGQQSQQTINALQQQLVAISNHLAQGEFTKVEHVLDGLGGKDFKDWYGSSVKEATPQQQALRNQVKSDAIRLSQAYPHLSTEQVTQLAHDVLASQHAQTVAQQRVMSQVQTLGNMATVPPSGVTNGAPRPLTEQERLQAAQRESMAAYNKATQR